MAKNIAVIICAAGQSRRFGNKRKKQFTDVSGRAVFIRSIEMFANRDDVKKIILAISPEDEELVKIKWGTKLEFFNVKTCIGGKERFETVQKALDLISDDIDLIAVHDSVRCCITEEWIDDVFKLATKTKAAILACPVTDTIKKCADNQIIKTIDRSDLYQAQTPQVFDATLLKDAYKNLDKLDSSKISDDAMLLEALGHKVAIIPTDSSNIKITKASDISIAEAILKSRPGKKQKGYRNPFHEAQW